MFRAVAPRLSICRHTISCQYRPPPRAVHRVRYSQVAEKPRQPPPQTSKRTVQRSRTLPDIMKFLKTNNQRAVPTAKRNEILTNCPHCMLVRKASFGAQVNLDTGAYKCKRCHTSGGWHDYSKTLLQKLSKDMSDQDFAIQSASKVMTNEGQSSAGTRFTRPLEEILGFHEQLANDSDSLNQLSSNLHLTEDTLRKYRVGIADYVNPHAKHNNQDEAQEPTPCLTFPQTTWEFEEGTHNLKVETTRLKVCSKDAPTKAITYDPPVVDESLPSGLFGYHTASLDADKVIITRREVDAMAAYQGTGIPSFALPSHTYQLPESVLPLVERFSRIYLWLDDDVNGQLAAEKFANKLGERRCKLVSTLMGEAEGPTTAYQALLQGKEMGNMLSSARQLKHDQILDFNDLRQEVYREITNPEQSKGVQSTELPVLNDILKGHRPGEFTILTGPTGSGKTTIISQLSLDYCKSGVPTLWGSFEILNKRLARKMLYQFANKDLSKAPEEFDYYADQFEQLPLYFLKFFSSTAITDVLKACEHAVYAYDIQHIILDNLQFMLSQQGRTSRDRWELQDDAIAELRKFATQENVHITLVVHPRKEVGELLDINSVFGSAKVTQEADNVIIIQKGESMGMPRFLDIKKNRFDGTLGSIPYHFMPDALKIRAFSEDDLIKYEQQKKVHQRQGAGIGMGMDRGGSGSQSTRLEIRRPSPSYSRR